MHSISNPGQPVVREAGTRQLGMLDRISAQLVDTAAVCSYLLLCDRRLNSIESSTHIDTGPLYYPAS